MSQDLHGSPYRAREGGELRRSSAEGFAGPIGKGGDGMAEERGIGVDHEKERIMAACPRPA